MEGDTKTKSDPPQTQQASDTLLPALLYSLPARSVHHPVEVPNTVQLRPAKKPVPPASHPGSLTQTDGVSLGLLDGISLGRKEGKSLGTNEGILLGNVLGK